MLRDEPTVMAARNVRQTCVDCGREGRQDGFGTVRGYREEADGSVRWAVFWICLNHEACERRKQAEPLR